MINFDNANRATHSWDWNQVLNSPPQYGWICPRCGRVWSPSMIMCTCSPVTTVTSGSTQGTIEEMANDPAIQAEMKAINEEFASADADGLEDLP